MQAQTPEARGRHEGKGLPTSPVETDAARQFQRGCWNSFDAEHFQPINLATPGIIYYAWVHSLSPCTKGRGCRVATGEEIFRQEKCLRKTASSKKRNPYPINYRLPLYFLIFLNTKNENKTRQKNQNIPKAIGEKNTNKFANTFGTKEPETLDNKPNRFRVTTYNNAPKIIE